METIRHVDGPGRFSHAALDRVSGYGDTHEVTEGAAEYLCDDRGFFERVQAMDVEFTEVDADDADGLEEKTVDELSDLAAEAEIEGRSGMNKDELIAALRED
ncbi:hypothetical protein CP556_08675 [Natrinema sp. CBA1119]|uniref:Rho termination factor N-terminal domain-containing protein n=1 Tax=Natrinema sp. CBA1119 TaxID=1608465 RepID=UPI000BF82C24|nr:Rho termination factor N-terminal domain-containing protein [Natrinema sp. CBA1119]PGF16178.1 hypothetical protein CP556_08675 [Natrinema sp. CBA1119]